MAFDPNAIPTKGSGYGGTTAAGTVKPIGVPAGFTTSHVPRGSFGHPTGPQIAKPASYYSGDEWGSVAGFPTNPSDIAQLQKYLVQSGLLDDKKVVYGQWDAASATAFKSVLGTANQQGAEWQSALAQRLQLADQQDLLARQNPPPKRAPLQVTVHNPADIQAAADSASQALYAGKLSPDEMHRFISDYQGQETQAQTDSYNTNYSGGTSTAAPDLGTAAENAVRQAHPNQVFVSALGQHLAQLGPSITQPGGGFL